MTLILSFSTMSCNHNENFKRKLQTINKQGLLNIFFYFKFILTNMSYSIFKFLYVSKKYMLMTLRCALRLLSDKPLVLILLHVFCHFHRLCWKSKLQRNKIKLLRTDRQCKLKKSRQTVSNALSTRKFIDNLEFHHFNQFLV